ncbi:MAG: hypothetical protein U0269_28515 [Polyangiales bacterium]
MTRSPSHRWCARRSLALVAMMAVGCKKPTAILVTVDTNIPTARPLELTARIAESDEGAISGNQLWSRGVSVRRDTLAFPASFTIRPRPGDSRGGTITVWLDVNALPWTGSMDTMRFTKKLRVAFTPGQIVRVPVFLAAECGARATDCPPDNPSCTLADQCEARGLSCGAGGQCEPLMASTVPIEDYDAQFAPIDSAAAMDASMSDDATARDGAAMEASVISDACAPSCAGRECGSDGCGGTCGSCAARPNMVPMCSLSGRCEYECVAGFGDCDAMSANGCETALNSSTHCGACGRACSGAAPNCVAGSCDSGCGTLSRCGMSCVDLNTSESNCGACGNACSFANATAVCVMGTCAISACNAGFANCDRNAANGCEVSLATVNHCSGCFDVCQGSTPVCDARMSRCVSGCSAPAVRCGMSCVDTTTDVNHCGACGSPCPARANATVSCAASACRFTCNPGFGDCDGNAANGCETSLDSTMHCGACGRACAFANGSAACMAGACALTGCATGFGNCDGMSANGCESPLNTTSNCTACGTSCSTPNASATCSGGSCQVAMCNAGFGNCDGMSANGCEVDTRTSATHCGMCGRACTNTGETCVSGACQCPAGQAVCGTTCAAAPGTACTRTCYSGATWSCSAGALSCSGGTMQPDGTPCGAGGRQCNGGSCTCPAGTCFRCGMCQGCTGACV